MNTDGTSAFLRWGIAVLALIIALTCWVVAATAPEVDLEDGEGEIARPLFARAEESTDEGLDAMDWEVDDENVEQVSVPVQAPKGDRRRKRRAEKSEKKTSEQDD